VLLLVYLVLRPRLRSALVAVLPLALTAVALFTYNFVRFGDPLEFGHRYQLTYMSMEGRHVCGVRSVPELLRAVNSTALYVAQPPYIHSRFPFIGLRGGAVDRDVSFSEMSDEVAGLAALAPLAMLGSLFALRLRDERASRLVLGVGWLVLLGLATCWHVSARYEADFWFLISAGAIVCVENVLARIGTPPLRILIIVAALLTSLGGAMLGFRGTAGAFPYFNPELHERLSRVFG
jgi:hypothetical protein